MADIPSRLVDCNERRLYLYSRRRPARGDGCGRMRKKEIIRVQKDQDRIAGKRPSIVEGLNLTPRLSFSARI